MKLDFSLPPISASFSAFEKDLSYLYKKALMNENIIIAFKIKELHFRLLSLKNQKTSLILQNLSAQDLAGLIDQATLLLSDNPTLS